MGQIWFPEKQKTTSYKTQTQMNQVLAKKVILRRFVHSQQVCLNEFRFSRPNLRLMLKQEGRPETLPWAILIWVRSEPIKQIKQRNLRKNIKRNTKNIKNLKVQKSLKLLIRVAHQIGVLATEMLNTALTVNWLMIVIGMVVVKIFTIRIIPQTTP
jgi:hypothetical protein